MDVFIQNGIDWIIAIQSLGSWLEYPMKFFTFLGNENFFFLVLPLMYWSVDAGLGLRIALILVTGDYLNSIVKYLFAAPRPYWVSAQVKPFAIEHSFGIPSGHAQNCSGIVGDYGSLGCGNAGRGGLPSCLRFWSVFRAYTSECILYMMCLLGWLIGYALLFLFLKFWDPVAAWLKTKTLHSTGGDRFCRLAVHDRNRLLSNMHVWTAMSFLRSGRKMRCARDLA